MIRTVIAGTSQASGIAPDRRSFSITLNTARDQADQAVQADQADQAQGVIADSVIDLVGAIGHAVLGALMPARRIRLGPRAVKRPLSRYAHKSIKVDRRTYKCHHQHRHLDVDFRTVTSRP